MENYDFDKKSLETRYQEREKFLGDKLDRLENINSELTNKRMELESMLKDTTTRLRIIDRDYVVVQKDLEKMKDDSRELQKEKYDLERQNAGLSVVLI